MIRLRKVPEINAYFWIVKVLTTAMGEATSDYLVHQISPYLAVAIGGVGLCIALVLQFGVHKYITWIYWFAVLMVAVFGTMAADVVHIEFGVPYVISSGCFFIILLAVFFIWYRVEKTLSIHSITTFRREIFYWVTVMATFALGTAAGDMTASTLGLGYFVSGLLFLVLISIPAVSYKVFKANEVATFWIAYILTRPLGASFADWFGKPQAIGGLGKGDGTVSIILGILIFSVVLFLAITKKDIKRE
jgi:uncharacterized membrane-anchored protein